MLFLNKPRRVKSNSKSDHSIIKVNSSDFLITQITIITSCDMEEGSDFVIKPECVQFINANGNAWKNEDVKKFYETFIGGHNFLEHKQDEKKSYGFIADAVLRERKVNDGTTVYDVDLLVATAKRNTPNDKIAEDIEKNKMARFSMGCVSTALQCSYCGCISEDSDKDCDHMRYKIGKSFVTKNGGISEIAALVVPLKENGEEGSLEFIEASIVKNPAYTAAVLGYVLEIPDNQDIYFSIPTSQLNRKNFNAIKYWKNKGMVQIIK